ncbi:hypothetical protein [Thalassoglobus sp.]|uniref:hypothetical protein n=1 Tax=Thalassoglobus sp. TaxID=2795869 RepID=UPI003AA7C6B7
MASLFFVVNVDALNQREMGDLTNLASWRFNSVPLRQVAEVAELRVESCSRQLWRAFGYEFTIRIDCTPGNRFFQVNSPIIATCPFSLRT